MKDQYTEIREAIGAADQTLFHLYEAQKCLKSAGNWGILDILGGDLISTFMKRKRMGNAEQELSQARYAVQNLARELQDVNDIASIHIETDDFLSFADYFFDGVIADWMVQSRIANAKRQVEQAIYKVETLKKRLQSML